MLHDPRRAEFVRHYCRAAAARGELRMGFLRIDGRAIAMQIGAVVNDGMWLVKVGYDDEYARASPGVLLLRDAVAHATPRVSRTSSSSGAPNPGSAPGPATSGARWVCVRIPGRLWVSPPSPWTSCRGSRAGSSGGWRRRWPASPGVCAAGRPPPPADGRVASARRAAPPYSTVSASTATISATAMRYQPNTARPRRWT